MRLSYDLAKSAHWRPTSRCFGRQFGCARLPPQAVKARVPALGRVAPPPFRCWVRRVTRFRVVRLGVVAIPAQSGAESLTDTKEPRRARLGVAQCILWASGALYSYTTSALAGAVS